MCTCFGGVIYEDDHWHRDHSVSPCALRGWLILKPKRHVEHLGELTQAEADSMGPLVRATSLSLMRALGAERVYALSMGELVATMASMTLDLARLRCSSGAETRPSNRNEQTPCLSRAHVWSGAPASRLALNCHNSEACQPAPAIPQCQPPASRFRHVDD